MTAQLQNVLLGCLSYVMMCPRWYHRPSIWLHLASVATVADFRRQFEFGPSKFDCGDQPPSHGAGLHGTVDLLAPERTVLNGRIGCIGMKDYYCLRSAVLLPTLV